MELSKYQNYILIYRGKYKVEYTSSGVAPPLERDGRHNKL